MSKTPIVLFVFALLVIVFEYLCVLFLYWLWNTFIISIFPSLPVITQWQALGLLLFLQFVGTMFRSSTSSRR